MNIQILPGYMLGQYEIRDFLGAGSMGAVYRGYQLNLKREVAIKVLPAMLALQPGYIQRFNREAETVAKLEHAHIIPIYDFGMVDSVAYIVMRLLTGGTLYERVHQQMVEKGVMPSFGEVAALLRQLAGALDYAHNQGVIHRDIKPNNVMFDNHGFAFITDFGLAKITDTTSSLTGSNSIIGTPTYMAPEQWRSEDVVPATDQYAVGVMTYSLVTGRLPFEAPTPYGLMHKHLTEAPALPHHLREVVPVPLSLVLQRVLAKEPSQRFATMSEFADAFEQAVSRQPGEASGFFTALVKPSPQVAPTMMLVPEERPSEKLPVPAPPVALAPVPEPSNKRFPRLGLIGGAGIILIVLLGFIALSRNSTLFASKNVTDTPTPTQTVIPSATLSDAPTSTETATSSITPTLTGSWTATLARTATSKPSATKPPATSKPAIRNTQPPVANATAVPPTTAPGLLPTSLPVIGPVNPSNPGGSVPSVPNTGDSGIKLP